MEKRMKYIMLVIIAVVFITLVVLGFLFGKEMMDRVKMKRLLKTALEMPPQVAEEKKPPENPLLGYMIEPEKERIIENTREVVGKVTQVSENSFFVEADIIDFEKFGEAESLDDLPKTKKNYTVAVNGETEFLGNKLSEIKTDDPVKVYTNDLVYKTDTITATRVICLYTSGKTESIKPVANIIGEIKKIEDSILTIETLDPKNKKTYAVKTIGKTRFMKSSSFKSEEEAKSVQATPEEIKLSDLKTGDKISVGLPEEVGNKTEFEALNITLILPSS